MTFSQGRNVVDFLGILNIFKKCHIAIFNG